MVTRVPTRMITTTGVQAGSYTAADITVNEAGQITSASSGTGGGGATVTILSVIVTSNTYANLDDTAVDISGGYIKIIGTGFASGCTVLVNNIPATSTTFIGPTEVRAQLPATAAGTYVLYVVNANGSVAIRVNGITFSATPSWINSSDLSSHPLNEAISIQLSATSATTYALQSGSSLPAGLTLSSSGLLSGTVTGLENDTSYSFAIIATDAELQDSPRTFTITIVVQVQVSRSLRFNATDTTYLSRTFPTAGNRRLWTFSAWYKRSNLTDTGNGLFQYGPDGNNQFRLLLDSSGTITIMDRISAVYIVSMTTTAVFRDPGAWYHIVITYDTAQATAADRVKLYINGTQITSFSTPTYPSQNAEGNVCSASTAYIGRGDTTSVYYYSGYLTEVQLVDGQALTPTAFALTNTTTGQYGPKKYTGSYGTNGFYLPFTDNSSVANLGRNYEPLTADPLWPQTVLLLNGTGTNNANNNTFTDSSSNAFAITRNGNTSQGTFSPFSQTGWGNYFDGTGDYLTLSPGAAFAFGSGDFTVELFVYITASAANYYLIDARNASQTTNWFMNIGGTNNWQWYNTSVVLSGGTPVLNQWNHVVYVRSGTTGSLFVNGSRVATQTDSYNYSTSPTTSYIASRYSATEQLTGYISNLRIVKGSAVYDPTQTTLTVPTTPLTAITNTSLLTCQSNRFIDASTNTFTITRNGDVSVVAFSPFTPTTAYSAATHGGSGYFDGSGDYLTAPDNTAFTLGSSDFCIELWINPSSSMGSYAGFFGQWANATTDCSFTFRTQASQIVQFAYTTNGNGQAGTSVNGLALTANSWNHLVVCRSGTNLAIFQNGTRTATHNISTLSISDSSRSVQIGFSTDGSYVTGYLSNLRFVKGSSVYDPTLTSITVPTAPLTAITNTQLLLNFTNAGIYDASGKNVLETVGDAKTSTAQSKWGGSSIYFDGNGDGLTASDSASQNIAPGSGNFTAEGWVYIPTLGNWFVLFSIGDTVNASGICLQIGANGRLVVVNNNQYRIDVSSGAVSAATWTHLALVRAGTTVTIYVNGVSIASGTLGSTFSGRFDVGSGVWNGTYYPNSNVGYIDDFRYTRGYARYTANFTAPTAQFAYNQSDINYKQWVPTNFSVTAGAGNDSVVDTPTNWGVDTGLGGEVRGNYCTLNPLANSGTLSNGNLDYAGSSASQRCRSTFVVSSGKWYWEVTNLNVAGVYVGVVDPAEPLSNEVGAASTGYGIYGSGTKLNNNVSASYAASWLDVGSVIGIALDLDAGTFACYINGVYQGIAYSNLTGPKMPALSQGTNNASVAVSFNFGQRPFAYAAPSGFKALNTHNLPALAVVKSNTAFDAKAYTGNGTSLTVSEFGFAPDLVWIKGRSTAYSHYLFDTIRGATKMLYSESTSQEDTGATSLTAFTSNGFTVGTNIGVNNNATSHIAWAWDAGTTTVVNTAGTIQSNVRVNSTSGFSIVSWIGTGANATVGHGLNAAPQFIIVKNRDTVYSWRVWHKTLFGTQLLYIDTADGVVTDATMWNSTIPTSTVFSLGTNGGVNESTKKIIAYCFAEVPGFSSFGSYTGNSSTDGPFVYTGFRPALIIFKRSSGATNNWRIIDSDRSPYNQGSQALYPNTSETESLAANDAFDILSNGFKMRGTAQASNETGSTYIYAAFAEQPFKYSRAR